MFKYTTAVAIMAKLIMALAPAMEQGCQTLPTPGGTRSPERCIFPFIYRGRQRNHCITEGDPNDKPWCSVQVNKNGKHVGGKRQWGHCDPTTCKANDQHSSVDTCWTVGGNVKVPFGTPCDFPFIFRGVKYSHCTKVGAPDSILWCSTQTNRNGEHVLGHWAHCHHSCPRESSSYIPETTTMIKAATLSPPLITTTGTISTSTTSIALTTELEVPSGTYLPSTECRIQSVCSTSLTASLIGGKEAKVFEYPFMALIGYCKSSDLNEEIIYGCGGTIVNNWYVLSAAHCFGSTLGEAVEILLGELDLKTDIDCIPGNVLKCAPPPQKIPIEKVIKHHLFSKGYPFRNDIALVRLSKPAQFNPQVQPVCLPTIEMDAETVSKRSSESLNTYKEALILGWGKSRLDDNGRQKIREIVGTSVLQQACLPLSSFANCSSTWPGVDEVTQVCAGKIGVDSCNGDSGGPMLLSGTGGSMVQVGIVSFGSKTCGNGKPAVYTRVKAYMDWIKSNL